MLSVMLGNYRPGAGEAELTRATTEMIHSLAALQRKDARGEKLEGFDESMLTNLRELDFGNLEMRLVRCDRGMVRLDVR